MPVKSVSIEEPLVHTISEEELEVVRNKQQVLSKLLNDAGIARYKIEVLFAKNFSLYQPSAGAVSFWESGAKLHGGGDSILHICPGKRLKVNDCDAFIPDPAHGYGFLICPECLSKWSGKQVSGQVLARLTVDKWAEVLHRYFLKLSSNADLVMKYYPGSLIEANVAEKEKERLGEEYGKVRNKRTVRIYPLANIIKDTSAGADLYGRILAFLKA